MNYMQAGGWRSSGEWSIILEEPTCHEHKVFELLATHQPAACMQGVKMHARGVSHRDSFAVRGLGV